MPPPNQPRELAHWPPAVEKPPPQLPKFAIGTPLPLPLTEAPTHWMEAAAAAKVAGPYFNTAIDATVNKLDIIKDMDLDLDREEAVAQVYLSPSPYFEAFEEEVDIAKTIIQRDLSSSKRMIA